MGRRSHWFKLVLVVAAVAAVSSFLQPIARAEALDGSSFDPGYIISDAHFFDSTSMDEAAIQGFLNSKEPTCSWANGMICLRYYTEYTASRPAVAGRCDAYSGAPAEAAARIVNKVAKACGINPQVLLVTLQKEQGLITASAPSPGQYEGAMGYGCPDTPAGCEARYYGFFNQVYSAALQFKTYGANPTGWTYRIGQVPILYKPGCTASIVNIRNQATVNLYIYTPYQPNAAALANLNGQGDDCSSYGNRNFWVYFNNWFGPTTDPVNPIGRVEAVRGVPGGVQVSGWAIDFDTKDPIAVHVYVDGVGKALVADAARADVGAAYPSSGANHGFGVTLPAAAGNHQVCVYGINVGPGSNVLFGCWTATTPGGSPFGILESVTTSQGKIAISGWTIDPDTTDSIPVKVVVDGVNTVITSEFARNDVAAAYPGYGPNHAFSAELAATPGSHAVCVTGVNTGVGSDTQLGCRTVVVPAPAGQIPELGRAPIGNFEGLSVTANTVSVSGWALDPDTAESIAVHVYIDAKGVATVADKPRNDIAAAFPAYGANHGFAETYPASPGLHTACVYAINTGPGAHTLLGCRAFSIAQPPGAIPELGRAPFGNLEGVSVNGGTVTVSGWAIDPDTANPIRVDIYVDALGVSTSAGNGRDDVGNAYPGYGANHGFAATLTPSPGNHTVCAYAINNLGPANTVLGCRTITVN